MRLLFIMAQAYFPRQAGGMQVVTRDLARQFAGRGHDIGIAAEMSLRGLAGAASAARAVLNGGNHALEAYDGIPVYRARKIGTKLAGILRAFRPDCVIVQSMDALGIARAVADRRIPVVVCWHDVETHRLSGTPVGLPARFVANSEFTAAVYKEAFGIESAVVPPLILADRYRVAAWAPGQVTFVNPVADKGRDIAFAVAEACPDIPFEFVESWILSDADRTALLERLRALPHARFTPHQEDMRPIYARTKILLAPSQWREAWGRVASEAHVNGIPVVASRIGGLPESVGPGGILLPPDAPVAEWVAALRSLWDDPARFKALSALCADYARREALDADWAAETMLDEVRAAIALRS